MTSLIRARDEREKQTIKYCTVPDFVINSFSARVSVCNFLRWLWISIYRGQLLSHLKRHVKLERTVHLASFIIHKRIFRYRLSYNVLSRSTKFHFLRSFSHLNHHVYTCSLYTNIRVMRSASIIALMNLSSLGAFSAGSLLDFLEEGN